MPLYEYECSEHGAFEAECKMAEWMQPGICPLCAVPAARILSVPRLRALSPEGRIARERNERSRHAPRVAVREDTPRGDGPPRWGAAAAPGARPWALGHG